jgi:hypothetical protein
MSGILHEPGSAGLVAQNRSGTGELLELLRRERGDFVRGVELELDRKSVG